MPCHGGVMSAGVMSALAKGLWRVGIASHRLNRSKSLRRGQSVGARRRCAGWRRDQALAQQNIHLWRCTLEFGGRDDQNAEASPVRRGGGRCDSQDRVASVLDVRRVVHRAGDIPERAGHHRIARRQIGVAIGEDRQMRRQAFEQRSGSCPARRQVRRRFETVSPAARTAGRRRGIAEPSRHRPLHWHQP